MKILIAQTSSWEMKKTVNRMKGKLEGISSNIGQNITVEIWDGARPVTNADIRKSEADLFVNFNLAGFGQSTLTDGIAYNLLDCKQVHILLGDSQPEEKYLAKQLSISMFFYCTDIKYFRHLQDKYTDLPYLKVIEGWKEGKAEDTIENNAEALCGIIRDVSKICRMLP